MLSYGVCFYSEVMMCVIVLSYDGCYNVNLL